MLLNKTKIKRINKMFKKYTLRVYVFGRCRGRSSGGRRTSSRSSIGSPLTTVPTLLVLSSSLVMVGRQKRRERRRSLFAAFFAIDGHGVCVMHYHRVLCS